MVRKEGKRVRSDRDGDGEMTVEIKVVGEGTIAVGGYRCRICDDP